MMSIMINNLEKQGILDTAQALHNLWMGNEELRNLASKGHVLGLHSYSHPTTMGKMPVEEQREEYGKNFEHLSSLMPSPPKSMAHPCNSFNEATVTVMNELGIHTGFRSDMVTRDGPYSWPRNDNTYLLRELQKVAA
jgi:peptidoglycan/xylan/chitin deacetylase (PgdA/CDA1 family)